MYADEGGLDQKGALLPENIASEDASSDEEQGHSQALFSDAVDSDLEAPSEFGSMKADQILSRSKQNHVVNPKERPTRLKAANGEGQCLPYSDTKTLLPLAS